MESQGDDPDWQAQTVALYLDDPPLPVQIGIGVHGQQGRLIERYKLPTLWCIHFYRYRARLRVGECWFPLRPGFVSVLPPDVPQEYRYEGRSQHLYAHFRCAEPPLLRAAAATRIPLVQDLGDRFPALYESFEEIVRQQPRLPAYRLRARLWDILCQLSAPLLTLPPLPQTLRGGIPLALPDLHPSVRAAVQQIELRLGEPLRVAVICEKVGVSERYLSQLFRIGLNETVVGYIRQRRVERALHLLQHSTLPVKSVAIAVGIPDLHLFNKTVRAATGQSPRAFREHHAAPAAVRLLAEGHG